jgi:hypothetical protein
MADEETANSSEDYELVPYQEIEELKEQLSRLKETPIPTTKKLQVSIDELAMKIDRLTAIFEEAGHQIKSEEGGLSFHEKMKPVVEKMNKVLEQNSEIAKGIVALADLINDQNSRAPAPSMSSTPEMPNPTPSPAFPRPGPRPGVISPPPRMPGPPQGAPPLPPGPGMPPPPPKPKRKFF